MKYFFSLYLLLCFCSSYGQFQDVYPQPATAKDHPAYRQMLDAYDARRWEETFLLFTSLSDRYPEEADLYFYAANALYHNKQYAEASQYYQAMVALSPFRPVNLSSTVMGALYAKEPQVITNMLNILSFVPMGAEEKAQVETYLQQLLTTFAPFTDYASATHALRQGLEKYGQLYEHNMAFYQQHIKPLREFDAVKGSFPRDAFIQLKAQKDAGNYPTVLYQNLLGNIATSCLAGETKTEALFSNLLPELNAALANKSSHPFSKFFLYKQVRVYSNRVKNYDAFISASKIMLAELNQSGISPALSFEILTDLTHTFLKVNDINQAKEYGQTLALSIPKIVNQKTKTDAYNAAGVAVSYTDGAKAAQLFDDGIAYAKSTGISAEDLIMNRAAFIKRKVLPGAQSNTESSVLSENRGVLLADQAKYAEAIPHFVKAKKLIEIEMSTASPEKTKGLLLDYSRVSNLLMGCIAHVGNAAELLPVIEDVKGYSLAESTSKSKKRATLKEIQAVLQADEALLYFMDISAELYDGYYIPLLLTKDKVRFGFCFSKNSFLPEIYAGFNTEIGNIEKELAQKEFRTPAYTQYTSREAAKGQDFKQGEMDLLIELYRRKLSPSHEELSTGSYNPNIAKGIGMALYNMLLQMFEPELSGKKHLIFSLDGALNYLPFETLVTGDKRYLVQRYDISYIPSGTVLVNMRRRKQKTYSKSVLAFGDARYSARTAKGYPLQSQTDVDRIALKVKEAIATDQNLDAAFATFNKNAANYLEGTKKEVEMIKSIVPDADVFLNEKMTENEFKRLNLSGALNDYRIIHLASHAGVHPYVFDLSGIMFSIFPTPVGNEDGELVVSEVAKLKMAPELVMLSACQTGLGKLVPGDGVAGLNHAFLMAGADATIASLWSVNDYATSVLVSRLYQKVFQENKAYVTALNEVKREFINSGDPMLQLTLSWAPFIYTGR